MTPRFTLYRDGQTWRYEYRAARGRVVLRRDGFTSIDVAMLEIDDFRKARVLVASLPKQPKEARP